jgi:hypothetical protein
MAGIIALLSRIFAAKESLMLFIVIRAIAKKLTSNT